LPEQSVRVGGLQTSAGRQPAYVQLAWAGRWLVSGASDATRILIGDSTGTDRAKREIGDGLLRNAELLQLLLHLTSLLPAMA
jgi:hypothetical protein